MSTSRYYFPDIIEDDSLSVLAVEAKQALQQNENVVKIFQANNEFLYGPSPKQLLFLMTQNNKSVCSVSPSPENSPSDAKSNQGLSTPVTRNTYTWNLPRRHLQLDDAENKVTQSGSIVLGTPVRREMVTTGSKDENVLNPLGEKASMVEEQFSSPIDALGRSRRRKLSTPVKHQTEKIGSTDETILIPTIEKAGMTEKQFSSPIGATGNPKSDIEESPCSPEMVKMTENLTRAEKELGSPVEVAKKEDPSNHESPPSAEITLIREAASLTMNEEKSESPVIVRNIKPGNEESPRAAEITRMTSGLTVDNNKSRGVVRDNQLGGNSNTNTDSLNPEANTENSGPDSINKDSIKSDEETARISELSMEGSETPSPAKRYRMCNISTSDGHMFDSSAQNVGKTDSSLEVGKTPISPDIPDIKISPNEASKEITRDDVKSKSLSPKKRITKLFGSIPRVINSAEELEIEVSGDLDNNVNPSTSQNSSIDYQSRSTKDIKSPVSGESKTDTSPTLFEQLIPPSRPILGKRPGTNSPASDDDVFVKNRSDIPATVTMTTRDRPSKSESSLTSIDTDIFPLKRTIVKFNMLLNLRNATMLNNYFSLLTFQNGIQFLMSYVHIVEQTVLGIGILDREYSTKEFKETVNDASTVASKLTNKLKSWKRDVDFDVETWNKSFKQIHNLKKQYEPLLSNEGRPVVPLEIVQVYEYEMKAIWKRLDDMILMTDSRRALFSHIDHDVEKLMRMFVKCLIHVGILQPR